MSILNIAGYQFITLTHLNDLRDDTMAMCHALEIKGTILLSEEGINLNLAGTLSAIHTFRAHLTADPRFASIDFKESYSETQPFKRLKIKLKKEIITLRQPAAKVTKNRAPTIAPATLKQWLDQKKELTLLDTRNDYEIEFGSFVGAVNLHLKHFVNFPKASEHIIKSKPVVMFCTGGIRCEKAAIYLQNQGFPEVYQLDGGILNYFAQVGGSHYQGDCFVFDDRIALNPSLQPIHEIT